MNDGRRNIGERLSRFPFMIGFIRSYVIMDPGGVSKEQRKKDFELIRRSKWRGVIARLQRHRLCRGESLVTGRCGSESLRDKDFIFFISFHKNGTRSLHVYLEQLGLSGMHWPVFVNTGIDYEFILRPVAHDPKRCVEALAPLLAEYDFFGDVPFPGLFRELAESFPESKFILTHRPPQDWWESIRRHWHLVENPHTLPVFEAIQYGLPVGTVITDNDRGSLIEKYVAHNETVQTYFSGTERLLVADLNDQNLNVTISRFLGSSIVPPFPKVGQGVPNAENKA